LTIFDRIASQFKLQTPFVVYRKPNENVISGFFQKTKEVFFVEDFTEAGFIFSPFDNQEKAILIPENESAYYREALVVEAPVPIIKNKELTADAFSKENHLQLVNKAIEEIKKKQFQKVVVSRREEVSLTNFLLVESFKRLLHTYKNAFGYVWFHPSIGLWMGATPETLLSISEDRFKTMSLAGTQVYTGSREVIWQSKELEEQELVTRFITSQIKEIAVNLKTSEKETIKAGNLLHLRTQISGEILNGTSNLKTLLNALHPTPAVCGLPRLATKKFILKNEYYQRTFYTGFLGELNVGEDRLDAIKTSLFVNLRCMEIKDNKALLYVGGGITKESNAIKEWEETVSKTVVMKAIL
jgi:isochorismate synthase